MATKVTIPKLGLTMTEAKIVNWLKRDGEQVSKGEPIVVVMTAKVTCEIEAPATGILHALAKPAETCRVSEAIGLVLEPGEPVPSIDSAGAQLVAGAVALDTAGARQTPSTKAVPREVRSSPAARRLARELGVDMARVRGTGREGRITEKDVQRIHDERTSAIAADVGDVQATPLARRMAAEEGLDLAQVQGTGPYGRVTEDDVLRVLEEGKGPTARLPRVIPVTAMRQAIAEGMMQSLHSSAQLTLASKADATALVALRDVLCQRWATRISYTDLIVKTVATALREHPILNSTLAGKEIVLHDEVNVGVAVALEQGLIVPVVREADLKSLLEIHRTVRDLTERAREGVLSVDEVTGGTFTITNLGMYGVDTFTPIINPPQAAILGVGRIGEELALIDGQVAARLKMTLSLTIDHRVIDGAPGATFLQTVTQLLEHPALILVEGSKVKGER